MKESLHLSVNIRYIEDARRYYNDFKKSNDELMDTVKKAIKADVYLRRIDAINEPQGLRISKEQFMNLKLLTKSYYDNKSLEAFINLNK